MRYILFLFILLTPFKKLKSQTFGDFKYQVLKKIDLNKFKDNGNHLFSTSKYGAISYGFENDRYNRLLLVKVTDNALGEAVKEHKSLESEGFTSDYTSKKIIPDQNGNASVMKKGNNTVYLYIGKNPRAFYYDHRVDL